MFNRKSRFVGNATAFALILACIRGITAADAPNKPGAREIVTGTNSAPVARTNLAPAPPCIHLVLRQVDTNLPAAGPARIGIFKGSNQWTLWSRVNRSGFGSAVAGGSDLDGDGRPDLLIEAERFSLISNRHYGAAFLFLGGADGFNTNRVRMFIGPKQDSFVGNAVACPGDMNGDGFPEIAVAEYHSAISGHITGVTDALGQTVSYAYSTGGHITRKTLPNGRAFNTSIRRCSSQPPIVRIWALIGGKRAQQTLGTGVESIPHRQVADVGRAALPSACRFGDSLSPVRYARTCGDKLSPALGGSPVNRSLMQLCRCPPVRSPRANLKAEG